MDFSNYKIESVNPSLSYEERRKIKPSRPKGFQVDNETFKKEGSGRIRQRLEEWLEKCIDYEAKFAEYDARCKEADKLQIELNEKFKQDLFKELGIEKNNKREELFAKALELGHSAGFEEVYNYASNLVNLIK